MRKNSIVLAFAMLFSATVPNVAKEPISLSCAGTIWMPKIGIRKPNPIQFDVEVDLSAMLITGFIGGPYEIAEASPSSIDFAGVSAFEGNPMLVKGSISRLTGKAHMQSANATDPTMLDLYSDLMCTPAKPIF